MAQRSLSARHVLEFPYKRSVGPVIGRFLTELRGRRLVGIRGSDGRVLVPPPESDPYTGASLSEFVNVGPGGEVVSWVWVAKPRAKQPLDKPFAYALIKLDGADTPMLHVVDASESQMRTGMRVKPRWRAETTGYITDIECFEHE